MKQNIKTTKLTKLALIFSICLSLSWFGIFSVSEAAAKPRRHLALLRASKCHAMLTHQARQADVHHAIRKCQGEYKQQVAWQLWPATD